ncbi:AGE family epimerase/isomerase [Gleimia hominis]|uniref:AGE family epimerase/isomerase n=1 Tax=Gleimia hominis TaxID=595468 RepID=UPI000C800EFE|nr:AGE family epimerase/isomerase [Gleimia hominis]WIK64068.1 AGE family epimerase/isomerase [Gleimia hominis]
MTQPENHMHADHAGTSNVNDAADAHSLSTTGVEGKGALTGIPSQQWRHMQRDALVEFSKNAQLPGGFGYLDANGKHQADHGVELWINGRFTHVYACEVLRGNERARDLLDHGIHALLHSLRDPVNDGWFAAVTTNGQEPFTDADRIKQSYSHAFVVLAAASALQAGHPQAQELLDAALGLTEKYWWEPQFGRVREAANEDWSEFDSYRGINANMHTVESFLAVYDATGQRRYLDRAVAICRFVLEGARGNDWRIVEHYAQDWTPQPEYNRDKPADPFRPFGATVGHAFEWARLALQAAVVYSRLGEDVAWAQDAFNLIHAGVQDGWEVDGAPGFVYTTDFEGRPVTHERMHWVVCEALNAAYVARHAQAEWGLEVDPKYEEWEAQWWQYADKYLITAPGKWREELDQNNELSEKTWTGMPEIYHAYQALVLPDGDYAVSFAEAAHA